MKRRACKRAKEEKRAASWTKKEDEYLVKICDEVKHYNWRIICKQQNKRFKEKTRTPKECEERYNSLISKGRANKDWSVGEICALLCNCVLQEGRWTLITTSVPDRTKKETQTYLIKIITEVAEVVQDKQDKKLDTKNSTETLKMFTCIKLMLDCLAKESIYPNVTKLLKKHEINVKDCLMFLSRLGKSESKEIEWTHDKLNSYLLRVVENIQNNTYSLYRDADEDKTLDGLLHQRANVPFVQINADGGPLFALQIFPS